MYLRKSLHNNLYIYYSENTQSERREKIEKISDEFIEHNLKDLGFLKVECDNITLDINKT